jgi:hypothetical protein
MEMVRRSVLYCSHGHAQVTCSGDLHSEALEVTGLTVALKSALFCSALPLCHRNHTWP